MQKHFSFSGRFWLSTLPQLHLSVYLQESMTLQGKDVSTEHCVQLHSHLQHCQQEIQQRDLSLQQLNIKVCIQMFHLESKRKCCIYCHELFSFISLHVLLSLYIYQLQQAIEEKEGVSSQLSTVSKMLRDTQQTVSELQNRCYWQERQFQNQYSHTQVSLSFCKGAVVTIPVCPVKFWCLSI